MSIIIKSIEKVGEGVHSYFVYTILSTIYVDTNNLEKEITTIRRYSDFAWLYDQLAKNCIGYIIPPLPEKVVGVLQNEIFRERRRRGLQLFLQRIESHEILKLNSCFKLFLTASTIEFNSVKDVTKKNSLYVSPLTNTNHSKDTFPSIGNHPTTSLMMQKREEITSWLSKTYQKLSENEKIKQLAAKAGKEIICHKSQYDFEFDQLAEYVNQLYIKLKTLSFKAMEIHKNNRTIALSLSNLSTIFDDICHFENNNKYNNNNNSTTTLNHLKLIWKQMTMHSNTKYENFMENVYDCMRYTGAVQKIIYLREDARFSYQSQISNTISDTSFRTDLRIEKARQEFEKLDEIVKKEIQRFLKEKINMFNTLLNDLYTLEKNNHMDRRELFNKMDPSLDNNTISLKSKAKINENSLDVSNSMSEYVEEPDHETLDNCFESDFMDNEKNKIFSSSFNDMNNVYDNVQL